MGQYQVFLNHRGPDTKKTLVSLIYHRLTACHGLRVFLDQKELNTGGSLDPAIFGAIQSASVHITIFSEHYAESRWCLEELHSILISHRKRRTEIIPVFYHVKPADLRHIECAPYAEAFEGHRLENRNIEEWKKDLVEASNIVGVEYERDKSDHGELLEKIVKDVIKAIKEREPVYVAPSPIVLEQAVNEFMSEMQKHSDLNCTRIVGIVGESGVGKSTLARYFYNFKRPAYTRSCFLPVRDSHDKLHSLKQKLRGDLLGYCDIHPDDSSQGKGTLPGLRNHRVLIVLDDVDQIEQLNSLLDIDDVGQGSLILITSFDKKIFGSVSRKTRPVLYEVNPLQRKHAWKLFCQHAFLQSEQSDGFEDLIKEYEDLIKKYLDICEGLPLFLKVLGDQLRGTSVIHWQEQLRKFQLGPLPVDIKDKLMLCYNTLNVEEKRMFMDIGCFFVGEDKELAVRVLEGLDYNDVSTCLQNLRQKFIVEYHDDGQSHHKIEEPIGNNNNLYLPSPKGRYKIKMPNQFAQLARDIARETICSWPTDKPLWLPCSNDIKKMLKLQLLRGAGPCRIRGIRKDENLPADWTIDDKTKSVGVCLFVVEVPINLSSFIGSWDMGGALVWLRLRNVHSIFFPSGISLLMLRVLEVQGHLGDLEQLFDRFEEPPSDLRELSINATDTLPSTSSSRRPFDLEHTDKSIADSVQEGETATSTSLFDFLKEIGTAGIKWLQKVELKNIASLTSLPFDFSEPKNLRHLDLSGCTNLIQLPKSFSKLTHLQYLALRDCKNLSIPADILGEISTLEHVDFKGCVGLVKLPRAMASQKSLRYLNLLRTHLSQLPGNLELNKLEQLRIGSPRLTELPRSLGALGRLEELILIECRELKRISPKEIAAPNIKVLVIRRSPLTNFSFQDQGAVDVGMPVLRDFTLMDTYIREICIPDGVYPSLETVNLSGNFQLKQVNGLPSTLVSLKLQNCEKLETINLSNMVNLKFLDISGCRVLETLDVEAVTSLQEIKAVVCRKLKSLEGLGQGGRLNRLYISTDKRLIWNDICKFLRIPSFEKLSTAIFSGMADKKEMSAEQEMRSLMTKKFKLEVVDIVSDAARSRSHVKIENFLSYSAILMCFISSDASDRQFSVNFDASNSGGPVQKYTNRRGNGSGKSLDVFMWREDSDLFGEYKDCSNVDVYCSEPYGSVRGWMVMVDKNTDVADVCNEFINAFA